MMGRSGARAEGHLSTLMWLWRYHHSCWPRRPSPWPEPKATVLLLLLLLLPAGAWPQPWKGAEVRVTLIEKQLAAVYHTLLAREPITGTAPTKFLCPGSALWLQLLRDGWNGRALDLI